MPPLVDIFGDIATSINQTPSNLSTTLTDDQLNHRRRQHQASQPSQTYDIRVVTQHNRPTFDSEEDNNPETNAPETSSSTYQ
jgi:hypothetical protein